MTTPTPAAEPESTAARMARLGLRLGGRIPLRLLHAAARPAGTLAAALRLREARVAERNLALCYPALDAAARRTLSRDCLAHTAAGLLELSHLWGRDPRRMLSRVVAVDGQSLIEDGMARGRGVLLAAPHLGSWELLNLWLSSRWPLTVLYRAPEQPGVEALLRGARGALGAEQVRAEPAGVRTLLRRLHEGRMVGILPDQRPRLGEGIDAPFLGHPRHTMTLFPRLAARSGACVVFAFAERLPAAAGYRIHVLPAPDGIDDADPRRAAAALNAGLADCIARAPAQYQWTYKLFGYWQPGDPPNHVYASDPAKATLPREVSR